MNNDISQLSRRVINRFLVINLLRQKRQISRSDLAYEIGITRPAITHIVGDLLEQGFICESGTLDKDVGQGRKPTLIKLNANAKYAIGIDLKQRDQIIAAIVNLDCEILNKKEKVILDTNPNLVVKEIKNLTEQLIEESKIEQTKVFGIGISLPDYVDQERHRPMDY